MVFSNVGHGEGPIAIFFHVGRSRNGWRKQDEMSFPGLPVKVEFTHFELIYWGFCEFLSVFWRRVFFMNGTFQFVNENMLIWVSAT